MPAQPGYAFKIRIGNVAYKARDYDVEDFVEPQDDSNSEDAPYASAIPGLQQVRATIIQATFDDSANPFGAPLNLTRGMNIDLTIWIDGVNGLAWLMPFFLITSLRMHGNVRGLQEISLSGLTTGPYTDPGGA